MAALAVFFLLALVGTRGCEEKQGSLGAPAPTPTPTPTPSPTPTSSPAAAAAAAVAATTTTAAVITTTTTTTTTTTEVPPTVIRLRSETQSLSLAMLQRMKRGAMSRELPLRKYALLNSARLQGRGIVHSQRKSDFDGDRVEFCACDEKLYIDAMRYREYGAEERWCPECPEDIRELGPNNDNDQEDDDDDDIVEDFLHLPDVDPALLSQVNWRGSSLHHRRNGTEALHPRAFPVNTSVTRPFTDRQIQPILGPSSSRPVSSATLDPLSESVALRDFNRQPVFSQMGDNILTMLPSRRPFLTSGNQPDGSSCEGADYKMQSLYHNDSYHNVTSKRRVHGAHSVASTSTSEVKRLRVNVQSDHKRVPMAEQEDIVDERMEVDGGGERSDQSSTDTASVESDVAQTGTSDRPSGTSEPLHGVNMTPEDMDVDTGNAVPDNMELDGGCIPDMAAEVVVGVPREQNGDITQRKQADTDMAQDRSLKLPAATPEPQPGPSKGGRAAAPKSHGTYIPAHPGTRDSKNRLPVIHYAGARGEMFGPSEALDLAPPQSEDLNKELNRIFGVQDYCVEPHELKHCQGEMRVAVFGSAEQLLFTVYVECHEDPGTCPQPTVCSPVVYPFTVKKWKHIPFHLKVFWLLRRIGGRQHWGKPVALHLPTACFCAPANYKPREINIYNLPAFN